MVSIVCEAFGCPPDVALRQDWHMVKAILDYRAMAQAKDLHNTAPDKMSQGQAELWAEMIKAAEEQSDG